MSEIIIPGGFVDPMELEIAQRMVARLNEAVALDRRAMERMFSRGVPVSSAALARHSHFVIDGRVGSFGVLGLLNGLARLTPPLAIRAVYEDGRLMGFDVGETKHEEYVQQL